MAAQPVKYPSLLTGHILAYPGKQGFRMFTSVLKKKISCDYNKSAHTCVYNVYECFEKKMSCEYNKSVHTCVLQNQGNILASI